MLSVAFLIEPSMEHRIVERGQNSPRVLNVATFFAGWALLPLSIALAFDMYVVIELMLGTTTGIVSGCLFFVVALTFWYALAFEKANMPEQQSTEGTPLATQVDQLGSVLFRIGRSASDGARVITPHRIQW